MSKLDATKEHIGYLKLWFGILLATLLSLSGWTVTNFSNVSNHLTFIAMGGVGFMAIALVNIHLKINSKILELEDQ